MLETLTRFAIALFIGALVGIDREKKQEARGELEIGGIRTFILFAQAGAVAAWLSTELDQPWIFAAATLGIAALIIAGHRVHAMAEPEAVGLTTEVAAFVVFLLGGATLFGQQQVAVPLAIATSALLAFKGPIHGAVGKLSRDDIYAGLKLLIASFIVLPVLPDRTVDPWGALNPYKMWLLVILISGLSLVGYVATRWLGPSRGLSLTGIAGGLVSSTAVTLSFARRGEEAVKRPALADALAAGIVAAWAVMFVRVVVEVAVVHPPLLASLLWPMALMAVAATGVALLLHLRGMQADAKATEEVPLTNPFSLMSATKFALVFAAVLLVTRIAQQHVPDSGMYVVAALAGLTDVDAITLSMAQLAREGGSPRVAVVAIAIAAITNTIVKASLVHALSSRPLALRAGAALLAVLVAGALGLLLS